jgi:hypothetical protein
VIVGQLIAIGTGVAVRALPIRGRRHVARACAPSPYQSARTATPVPMAIS